MRATISILYFDGRRAHPQQASLALDAGQLHIVAPGLERRVPLGAVRLGAAFARAPLALRLNDGASCQLPAGAAREELLDALGCRTSLVARWQAHRWLALLALPLLIALLAVLYTVVLPLAAVPIAATLPPAIDASLGRAGLASLEAHGVLQPSRLPAQRIAEVQGLLPEVAPAHPRVPLHLLLRDAPRLGANSVAFPDGTIVVTDDLVQSFENGDGQLDAAGKRQLAAILAHEVGHVEHRHMARKIVATSFGAALSAYLFGDFSEAAAALPAVLWQMHYSRTMETEADDYAATVLRRNGMGPAQLARALAALERRQPDEDQGYLSTHPATQERIARLRAQDAVDEESEDRQ